MPGEGGVVVFVSARKWARACIKETSEAHTLAQRTHTQLDHCPDLCHNDKGFFCVEYDENVEKRLHSLV